MTEFIVNKVVEAYMQHGEAKEYYKFCKAVTEALDTEYNDNAWACFVHQSGSGNRSFSYKGTYIELIFKTTP